MTSARARLRTSMPRRPLPRWAGLAAVVLASVVTSATTAGAQLVPNTKWRTIHTEHFQVHFSPGLEEHARRAAVNAERA